MGIDPVGVNESNIHSFNRYAYANNNPNRYVDPDGNSPLDVGYFAKDVGNLLVQEMVYAAAVFNGDTAVANMALEAMSASVVDAAVSTAGLINPVPGTSALRAAGKADDVASIGGKIEWHHSDPKFLGGAKNQDLTPLDQATHKALHKDMNDFLKTKVNDKGQHMRPQRGNSGKQIQDNFGRDQCVAALCEFYRGPGAKYEGAAKDFFKQHPGK